MPDQPAPKRAPQRAPKASRASAAPATPDPSLAAASLESGPGANNEQGDENGQGANNGQGAASGPAAALDFNALLSGAFDAEHSEEPATEEPSKRVLQPQADAPKLHKVLAQAGLGSRIEMEQLIAQGRIMVNDEPAHVGQRIQFGDAIRVNGRLVKVHIAPPPPRVLAYHKPAGEVVTHEDPQNRPTVFRRLPRLHTGKWQSVGRLDLNTEGLLLLTNSGELAHLLMHPSFGLQREYAVRVLGALSLEEKQKLLNGVQLDDGPAQFQSLEEGGGEGANCWYRVTIAEGRNREVRRMFESLGHAVSRLIRIRYGAVALPRGLRRGVWMELDARDVARLSEAAGMDRTLESRARQFQPPAPPPKRQPSRGRSQGPRPSAPKLVDGAPMPRSTGRNAGGAGARAPSSRSPDARPPSARPPSARPSGPRGPKR